MAQKLPSILVLAPLLLAAQAAPAEIGQIKIVAGQAFLIRAGQERPAKAGDRIEQADIIATGADGAVGITLIDNSRLSAGPDSRIEFARFRYNPTTQEGESVTEIRRGTLAVISGKIAKNSPDAMKVRTPTTILGVRGTTFGVKVDE